MRNNSFSALKRRIGTGGVYRLTYTDGTVEVLCVWELVYIPYAGGFFLTDAGWRSIRNVRSIASASQGSERGKE